ncbi:MAG TPA: histidine kinase N-terminal 7TM domain-containing protein [Bacteroidales bacterium]|nr:histidine kinase N-terminal 7TM domain-containing protein [Bacteroidales bacterium]
MQINTYSLILLIPAIISFWLAFEARKKRYAPRGSLFALAMLSVGLWSFTYAMELASTTQSLMQFWLKLEYVAIPWVSLLMMLVVLNFTDIETSIKWSVISYLAIIPLITMILAITHEHHQLYYKSVKMSEDGPIPLLKLEIGPWYYVHVLYSYALNLYALAVLVRKLLHQRSMFRNQLLLLMLAVLVPLLSFTLYFARLMPIKNIDPTPFAFSVSGLLMSVSIFRFRMLDLLPIAREHVFRSMSDGLLVIDSKLRLIDCNPVAGQVFKWNRTPFGKPIAELWADYPDLVALCSRIGEESLEAELNLSGEDKIYLMSSSDIYNHKNAVVGKLLVVHDITHRYKMQETIRKSEERLRALNTEKDKLFSIIAHDLRSPIGAFLSLTRLFIDDGEEMSREEMQEIALSMNRSAESLSGLLDNLLQWSRMQRNEVKTRPEILVVNQLVERNLQIYSEAIQKKQLTTETFISGDLRVFADENMLNTILRNLISNAIKFTQQGGKVSISAEVEDSGMIAIKLSDTGIGMSSEILHNLFAIDGKTNRPGTAGEPSTGLGLILCKEFAERSGGQLLVSSKPGEGSTFTLLLPASVSQTAP